MLLVRSKEEGCFYTDAIFLEGKKSKNARTEALQNLTFSANKLLGNRFLNGLLKYMKLKAFSRGKDHFVPFEVRLNVAARCIVAGSDERRLYSQALLQCLIGKCFRDLSFSRYPMYLLP